LTTEIRASLGADGGSGDGEGDLTQAGQPQDHPVALCLHSTARVQLSFPKQKMKLHSNTSSYFSNMAEVNKKQTWDRKMCCPRLLILCKFRVTVHRGILRTHTSICPALQLAAPAGIKARLWKKQIPLETGTVSERQHGPWTPLSAAISIHVK